MIIVPGVPLINGVQDMIKNHMTLGLARLGFAGLVTAAMSGAARRSSKIDYRSRAPTTCCTRARSWLHRSQRGRPRIK
jgi:hypothetical protein